MTGRTIELFLTEGTPGGLITAEVSSWTGKIISFPRKDLEKFNKRPEAQTNGVYILLGDDPSATNSQWCYIGRTENFGKRLAEHNRQKEKWQQTITISSLHHSFNEGHWGYMEARLHQMAVESNRCSLPDNRQSPVPRKLSEAQQAAADDFIKTVKMVLPILGVDIFRSREKAVQQPAPMQDQAEIFHITEQESGIAATMQTTDGEFFLLEGSTVAATCRLNAKSESSKRARDRIISNQQTLFNDGSLIRQGDVAIVQRDIPFKSPSAASNIALGRSTNGRLLWRTPAGLTYDQWENL